MPESILQRSRTRTEQLESRQPADVYPARGVRRLPDLQARGRQVQRRFENIFDHRAVGIQPSRNRAVSDTGRQRHQGRRPDAALVSRTDNWRHAEVERPPRHPPRPRATAKQRRLEHEGHREGFLHLLRVHPDQRLFRRHRHAELPDEPGQPRGVGEWLLDVLEAHPRRATQELSRLLVAPRPVRVETQRDTFAYLLTQRTDEGGVLGDGPCADLELDATVTRVPHAPGLFEYLGGGSCEQAVYRYHGPRRGRHQSRQRPSGRIPVQVPDRQLEPEPDRGCYAVQPTTKLSVRVHPVLLHLTAYYRRGEPPQLRRGVDQTLHAEARKRSGLAPAF